MSTSLLDHICIDLAVCVWHTEQILVVGVAHPSFSMYAQGYAPFSTKRGHFKS